MTCSAFSRARWRAGTSSSYALAAVGPVDDLDVPAVGLVALGDVLGQRDVGVVLDRDLVLVVDQGEVAELLGAGDRGRLGRTRPPRCRRRWPGSRRGGRRRTRPARRWGRAGRARGVPPSPCRPRCRCPGRAGRWWSRRRRCGRTPGGPGSCCPRCAATAGPRAPGPSHRGRAGCRGSGWSGRRRARTGRGRASAGRPGCGASPSGTAGTPPGARLIAVPGWPLPTFCTASIARTRTVSTAFVVEIGPVECAHRGPLRAGRGSVRGLDGFASPASLLMRGDRLRAAPVP